MPHERCRQHRSILHGEMSANEQNICHAPAHMAWKYFYILTSASSYMIHHLGIRHTTSGCESCTKDKQAHSMEVYTPAVRGDVM